MLEPSKHKRVFISILKDLYSDPVIRKSIGFKGGTAALLFYDLPRMSVDLDFDLLDVDKEGDVFERLKKILPKFGEVKDARIKHYTIFSLINYENGLHNVKIEISRRKLVSEYESKDFLGIPMLVMKKDDILANKLAALLTRKVHAARDYFDVWFFLSNHWDIDEIVLEKKTGLSLSEALDKAIEQTQKEDPRSFMQGMGELVNEKQKYWIKNKLREELVFELKLMKESRK